MGGPGADAVEARMLHLIGADNTFLQKSEEEQERLKDIANEVATSPDVLLCHSDLVEGITDGSIEACRDPVVIAFYSFVFHECTWTPTAMYEYADSFELPERKMFVLVRDVNSPTLQRFNQEIVRLDGDGAFTLSTPLEEHNRTHVTVHLGVFTKIHHGRWVTQILTNASQRDGHHNGLVLKMVIWHTICFCIEWMR